MVAIQRQLAKLRLCSTKFSSAGAPRSGFGRSKRHPDSPAHHVGESVASSSKRFCDNHPHSALGCVASLGRETGIIGGGSRHVRLCRSDPHDTLTGELIDDGLDGIADSFHEWGIGANHHSPPFAHCSLMKRSPRWPLGGAKAKVVDDVMADLTTAA